MVHDHLTDVVVARVGRPFVIEAVRMLEAGEGTVAGIDEAVTGAGYTPGPFQRLDEVGLDTDLAIDRELQADSPRSGRFDPPPLQIALVAEGRIGRAVGHGFYRYDAEKPPLPDVAVDAATGGATGLGPAGIVERLQLGIINEAYRVVQEGLASPPAIDMHMRARGHPHGPFELVDILGMRRIIDRLRATYVLTQERSDDQYLVATALWQMATV